ncbi:MAG: STAS domain-containing protein [Xanthomonadales bacterium]|jgi:anti-anti-sigma factor|nr:STAS domain-containing protein [Xanthomonadales bacterium]
MSDAVLHASHDGVHVLKLCGEIRHTLAEAIEAAADRIGQPRRLVLDLGEASFLDSTAIGLLVALAREHTGSEETRPTLICDHPEVLDLLQNLCLDELFTIVPATDSTAVPETAAVTAADPDELSQARLILKAHQALIEAHPGNREAFDGVVTLFREEVRRLTG